MANHLIMSIITLIVFVQFIYEPVCTYNQVDKSLPYKNEDLVNSIENYKKQYENNTNCMFDINCISKWIEDTNKLGQSINEQSNYLEYRFEVNITNETANENNAFFPIQDQFDKIRLNLGKKFYNTSTTQLSEDTHRMVKLISQGATFFDSNDSRKFAEITSEMQTIFVKAEVCYPNDTKKCIGLHDISYIMATSRDYDELLWAWTGWSNATGPKERDLFIQNVAYKNKEAKLNGYKDNSEVWIELFETNDFEKMVDNLFEDIKPMYEQLHAYARRKLRNFYGKDKVKSKFIPIHLTGEMFGITWQEIYDILVPFPNATSLDITDALRQFNYTPIRMFKDSEDFFVSMGLYKMTPDFWDYSMIVQPKDRKVDCHAAAFDFYNGHDFRIKMCTEVDSGDYYTISHEMGHIEYFMSYANQPYFYQDGANPGFHEALGDTIILSVNTPKHLKLLNLTDNATLSYESDINFLMYVALDKVAFLPFGYLVDKWRWNVFRGNITPDDYNKIWWEIRNKYQGVESPVNQTENDFNPGSLYHIVINYPYVSYFIASFLEFQFYQTLCRLANHTGPLHNCDFYGSKTAGLSLKQMMELGLSKHWTYTLKQFTGEDTINAKAIKEYFKPLMDWLIAENAKYQDEEDVIGW